ncbi:transporter [Pseudomonas paraveronii]|uniref:transporter n=1 Tax=Pseudomonas paraveronii TaxID=3040598 RepID=UPI002AB22C0C|nr:transporter [Pseudomonas sp. V3/K/3/5]
MKITTARSLRAPNTLESSSDADVDCLRKNNLHLRVLHAFRLLILILCLQRSIVCHALDVDPGDYTPMPDGTQLGLLYLQHAERHDYYARGNQLSDKYNLYSDVAILRGVSYQAFAGLLTNIQLLLPFGHLSTGGDIKAMGSESGMGDPILANAIWIYQDPSKNRALGLTQYLFLPIGDYSKNQELNIGENRWKYVLQGGYMHGIGSSVILDFVADVTFFGDNDSYSARDLTLKQDPQYQMQGFIRYKLSDRAAMHVGYSRLWGGQRTVDGTDLEDESRQAKIMLGGSYFVTPKVQLLATLGRDMSVENGFKEASRLNLRVLYVF